MIDIQALFPVMVAKNLEGIKQFYTTVFGFEAVFFDASFYLHLVSPSTGIQLGFLMPNHASQPEFLHSMLSSSGHVISFEVPNAASAYAEAQKLKLNITMPLKEEVWGQIHFMVEDPAGFNLDIVEHIEVNGPK